VINAARTLFLNLPGTPVPPVDPNLTKLVCEEYIPPLYAPKAVPAWLQGIRNTIFGINPDRFMMNYRALEMIVPLHSTELVEFILDLDPRITYIPVNSPFDFIAPGPFYFPLGATTQNLYINVTGQPVRSDPPLARTWVITVVDGSHIRFNFVDSTGVSRVVTETYSVTGGLAGPVTLPDSPFTISFDPGSGAMWQVYLFARPTVELPQMVANLGVDVQGPLADQLFNGGDAEPFTTFMNLWNDHPFLPYRLGGLTMAMIYQMNELS